MILPACCRTGLYASPQEGDTHHCQCGREWVAHTAPHVGVPTWWPLENDGDGCPLCGPVNPEDFVEVPRPEDPRIQAQKDWESGTAT